MKYVLLIYDDEKIWESMSPDESGAIMHEYFTFTQSLRDGGQYRAGEALQPIATSTTVRVRNGQLQTTDGPFAETREQLGGFYLVDAANLDEAIALAARIPSARERESRSRLQRTRTTGHRAPHECVSPTS